MTDDSIQPFDGKRFLETAPGKPGVYQMRDGADKILYVGKAKDLKKRLASYFRATGLTVKTQALVAKIADIQLTVTGSEAEALVLEHNLIKSLKPPYNILLRDDKSYPYIFIASKDEYPRIVSHRGARKKVGEYFGPYPNAMSVKEALAFLQKTFKLRPCEDSVFNNRSRPCLQHQIDRCSAPCVGLIDPDSYRHDINHAVQFLKGQSDDLLKNLAAQMEQASLGLNFERAASLRDQIAALRSVQAGSSVEAGTGSCDVIGIDNQAGLSCVHCLYIRHGRILGSRSFYPKNRLDESPEELLATFLAQMYLTDSKAELPRQIVVPYQPEAAEVITQALADRGGFKVDLSVAERGIKAKWQKLALEAAKTNLSARLNSNAKVAERFEDLAVKLGLDQTPSRLECFDISHSHGERTVASCVVFDTEGPRKSDYRRFNIDGIEPGDDYGAMRQALKRRYTRLKKGEGELPDILLVDGGKGQLRQAREILQELGVFEVLLIGIAKGETRKAGFETLFWSDNSELVLDTNSQALHLLQHIRDESHRFAITGHKARRDKARRTSTLEGIAGVGATRRRALLTHFGGLGEVKKARVEELGQVSGISQTLAQTIYDALHDD